MKLLTLFLLTLSLSVTAQNCLKPLELTATPYPNMIMLSCDGVTTNPETYQWRYKDIKVTIWDSNETEQNHLLLEDLIPYTTYVIKVKKQCFDSACPCHYVLSDESDSLVVKTLAAPPSGLVATSVTATSAKLKVDSALPYSIGYKFSYHKIGTTGWSAKTTSSGTILAVNIGSLTTKTTYEWFVQTKLADGSFSPKSLIITFTTL